MSSHREQCPLEKLQCPNLCEEYQFSLGELEYFSCVSVNRKDLAEHLKSKCYLRRYSCEHCGHEDTYQAITGKGGPGKVVTKFHYATCPDYPLECPNKCGENGIKRKDMPSHRQQCPLEPVQCLFQEAGCRSRLVRRDLEDHMATQMQHHLTLTFQTVLTLRKENIELKKELQSIRTRRQKR